MTKTYKTAAAFRQAIDRRIREKATAADVPIDRYRQFLLFERFFRRVANVLGDKVMLKGGVALELRLEHQARTTKDVDLEVSGDPSKLLGQLRAAGQLEIPPDFFVYEVGTNQNDPDIDGDGVVYEGQRFKVRAMLDGKLYGEFRLDVAFGDKVISPPDMLRETKLVELLDAAPAEFRAYPRDAHIAEKLHTYTLPRQGRANSRVKDLPDLALLAKVGATDSDVVRRAIEATFAHRNTHAVPPELPRPPEEWRATYERMAKDYHLSWADLDAVFEAAAAFINPALGAEPAGSWDATRWRWEPAR